MAENNKILFLRITKLKKKNKQLKNEKLDLQEKLNEAIADKQRVESDMWAIINAYLKDKLSEMQKTDKTDSIQ